ncbi:MAG: sortase, partial [Chloroflexi bacterium]|nr:sortase [Chloroflexota bacterium]
MSSGPKIEHRGTLLTVAASALAMLVLLLGCGPVPPREPARLAVEIAPTGVAGAASALPPAAPSPSLTVAETHTPPRNPTAAPVSQEPAPPDTPQPSIDRGSDSAPSPAPTAEAPAATGPPPQPSSTPAPESSIRQLPPLPTPSAGASTTVPVGLVLSAMAERSAPAATPNPPGPMPTPPARPTVDPTVIAALGFQPSGLRIPQIGVDAQVILLGLDATGAMESPDNPDDVAWYVFSAQPGRPGNAVFAGHVDWRTGVVGVFWQLKRLKPGAEIIVDGEHGEAARYVVEWSRLYDEASIPIAEIVGPTAGLTITLITCEGEFDPATRNYSQRRIVRAHAGVGGRCRGSRGRGSIPRPPLSGRG